MTTSNPTSTRSKDEIRVLAPWAFYLFTAVFVTVFALFLTLVNMDPHAPRLPIRCLLGMLAGAVLGCWAVLIGYINQDAGRRSMSRVWWTLLAIFVPNGLGIVLYFILRKPLAAHCPQCDAEVDQAFSFCPRCRSRLRPVCPHCQRSIDLGDKFCPYCGGDLAPVAGAPSPTAAGQP
jgi:hypothetical protein